MLHADLGLIGPIFPDSLFQGYHHDMKPVVDIVIIGGGVQGLTLALFLSRAGATVRVIDKGALGFEASWAGAGIIPPGGAGPQSPVVDRLRTLSSGMFPAFSDELLALTGISNGFRKCGSWHLPLAGDNLEGLRNLCVREGLPLESPSVALPWPGTPGESPLFLKGTMQVRNPWHLRALKDSCLLAGVEMIENCQVEKMQLKGGQISSITTPMGQWRAQWFVLAAGAWSGVLAASIGFTLPVKPIRGLITLLELEEAGLVSIVEQGKRYIVPRGDGLFLVGSNEEDAGFDKTIQETVVKELEAWASYVVPELAHARRKKCWAGLRPGSPDGMPFLGSCPDIKNLVLATGHFRAGLQLSLGTASLVSQFILGGTLPIPIEPFSPARPSGPLSGGFLN
ncbi:MAG: NAD(P)/FAD-dependent oxidoreductase [Planctomycetaceae bacterium]